MTPLWIFFVGDEAVAEIVTIPAIPPPTRSCRHSLLSTYVDTVRYGVQYHDRRRGDLSRVFVGSERPGTSNSAGRSNRWPKSSEREAKSAVRTVQILERLAEGDAPTLAELARDLDAPKSSLHVVVQTLIRRGWVQRDDAGRLAIGVRAVRVGTAFVDGDPVVALTAPVLDALVAELDETVHLGRLDGTDIVYLAKRESTQQLRLFSAVGRRLPAYTTALGKALLAGLPDEQLDEHLPARLQPMTEATITDRRQLRTSLAEIRERGWSSDEGENAVGHRLPRRPPSARRSARGRAVVLGTGDALRPGSSPRHAGCVDAGTRTPSSATRRSVEQWSGRSPVLTARRPAVNMAYTISNYVH